MGERYYRAQRFRITQCYMSVVHSNFGHFAFW